MAHENNNLGGDATPKHFDATSSTRSPSQNPIGDSFNVIVSVPQAVEIKMVDASALSDYEIWVFIASLLSNAVIGFFIAYVQAIDAKSATSSYIGWTDSVFTLLFLISLFVTYKKRVTLKKKGRDIKLRTTGAVEV